MTTWRWLPWKRPYRPGTPFRVYHMHGGTMVEHTIINVAGRLGVQADVFQAAVEAVALQRHGTADWTHEDRDVAEAALSAFLSIVSRETAAAVLQMATGRDLGVARPKDTRPPTASVRAP